MHENLVERERMFLILHFLGEAEKKMSLRLWLFSQRPGQEYGKHFVPTTRRQDTIRITIGTCMVNHRIMEVDQVGEGVPTDHGNNRRILSDRRTMTSQN